mgnify:CR=1 FL=1
MQHSLFSALDKSINNYLTFSKNDLIKLCKERGIEADYNHIEADLAFLLFRLEKVELMTTEDLDNALTQLGFKSESKKKNQIQLITFELCLVDLIDSSDEEIVSLCLEYEVEHEGLVKDEIVVGLAIKMCC